MSTDLPLFSESATCPKCGHDDVRVVYQATGCETRSGCDVAGWEHRYQEHLDRICQRCHYQWAEACLTAAADAPSAGSTEATG